MSLQTYALSSFQLQRLSHFVIRENFPKSGDRPGERSGDGAMERADVDRGGSEASRHYRGFTEIGVAWPGPRGETCDTGHAGLCVTMPPSWKTRPSVTDGGHQRTVEKVVRAYLIKIGGQMLEVSPVSGIQPERGPPIFSLSGDVGRAIVAGIKHKDLHGGKRGSERPSFRMPQEGESAKRDPVGIF